MLHTYKQQTCQVSTSYTLWFPRYSLGKIFKLKVQQGQRLNESHTITIHTYNPNQYPCQVVTSYTLQFPRHSPDKIFKLKVIMARSKIKSKSHHENANLQHQPISLSSINFAHCMIFKIETRQDFKIQDHCIKFKGQIKVGQ